MLNLAYRSARSIGVGLGLLSLSAFGVGCGPAPDPGPTEYVKFRYTVNPGITIDKPIVLTVGPAPVAMGMTCFRTQNQIYLYAASGVANVLMTLTGATATTPNQQNLPASTQTIGSVELDMQIPTEMDDMGNFSNPASFKTSAPGNALTCLLNLSGPDLFSAFDGTFTCNSLSTNPGRKLTLMDGQFHAVPCPASGG